MAKSSGWVKAVGGLGLVGLGAGFLLNNVAVMGLGGAGTAIAAIAAFGSWKGERDKMASRETWAEEYKYVLAPLKLALLDLVPENGKPISVEFKLHTADGKPIGFRHRQVNSDGTPAKVKTTQGLQTAVTDMDKFLGERGHPVSQFLFSGARAASGVWEWSVVPVWRN